MLLSMLKGKIHRAVVTQAELEYVGSITIDEQLMEAAEIQEYERFRSSMWTTDSALKPMPLPVNETAG